MEYIPHGDLGMYDGEIKDDDARIISQQLLEGLQIMHKKGFTHRDLKPQVIHNLIFTLVSLRAHNNGR
jgi:serine/threonine protein kinase